MFNNRQYYEFLERLDKYSASIRKLYVDTFEKLLRLGISVKFDRDKMFRFSDHRDISNEANTIIRKFYSDLYKEIKTSIISEWNIENKNIDLIVDRYLKTDNSLSAPPVYYAWNNEALKAFFSRKNSKGFNLSARVWKLTTQFKNEIELAVDSALTEGTSANKLARQIKTYLQNPDNLFRRVRNNRGELMLSKKAKAYNPGRGVYRSSYKNALRVARTEINMSYKDADYNRWQKLDFIMGYEVRRSNREFSCDMCESLKGLYPKSFRFNNWHPNCLCYAIPVLMNIEDFKHYMKLKSEGKDVSKIINKYLVDSPPEGFFKWIKENGDKIEKRISAPYFVINNFVNGNIKQGLKPSIINKKA